MKVTFKISRYNPEKDSEPHFKDYALEVNNEMTVLDALQEIKWYHDGTLTYRRSCRSAICGSCAMCINGRNRLACYTSIVSLDTPVVTIAPLPGLPIIKDLVVDQSSFFKKYESVKPYLMPNGTLPPKEVVQSVEDRKVYDEPCLCILCGACTAGCPVSWADPNYLGPAALTKVWRFVGDSRDGQRKMRIALINNDEGVWRCHSIFRCTEACPKKIDTGAIIQRLRREVVKEILGFRKH